MSTAVNFFFEKEQDMNWTKLDYISLGRECSNRDEWLMKTAALRIREEDAIMWARLYTDIRGGKERSIWDWLGDGGVKSPLAPPTTQTILDTARETTSLSALSRKVGLSPNKLRSFCETEGIWDNVKTIVETKRYRGFFWKGKK